MSYLITGGCGFVGNSLAAELLRQGEHVIVFDNLSRVGSSENLAFLRSLGPMDFIHGDIRIQTDVSEAPRNRNIGCIFHLAGQVAMTTSVRDSRRDFETNVVGTINVLEASRTFCPQATIVYASSNKVFGTLDQLQLREDISRYTPLGTSLCLSEDTPLSFRTPYGCSKGAADQYVLEYAKSFSLRTVVFRHSTIFGGNQFATFDQGWVSWFCMQALRTVQDPNHRFTVNGNGKQVRDVLHIGDAVQCYLAAHKHIGTASGQVFNIGGGIDNSMSVLELLQMLGERLGVKLNVDKLDWRADDQRYFVADITKAAKLLEWIPKIDKSEGIEEVLSVLQTRAKV